MYSLSQMVEEVQALCRAYLTVTAKEEPAYRIERWAAERVLDFALGADHYEAIHAQADREMLLRMFAVWAGDCPDYEEIMAIGKSDEPKGGESCGA